MTPQTQKPLSVASGYMPARRYPQWFLLAVFLFTLAIHFQQLKNAYQYPIFATDAVQYVDTAENLSLGRGYQFRGNFNTSLPPLYPLFLAVGHKLPGDPRTNVFLLSIFAMGAIVFPAFGLAQRLGFPADISLVLAAASGFLPHTVYAATSMAEGLHIPLVMFAVIAIWDWFEDPGLRQSAATGMWLNLLLLNKVAGWQLVVPFILVAIAFLLRRSKSPVWILQRSGLAMGIPLGTMILWSVYKELAHGNAIGIYGVALSRGLPQLSARMMALYIADYAAAGGITLLVPAIYWAWQYCRDKPVAVFFLLWFGSQVFWTGVVEGGLTGMLRERLFCVSLPVLMMVGVRGVQLIIQNRSLRWARASVLGGLGACAGLLAGQQYVATAVIESPWIHAVGAVAGLTGLRFSALPASMFVGVAAAVVPFFLWAIGNQWRIPALAGLLFLALGCQFLYAARWMRALQQQGLQSMAGGITLFKSLGMGRDAGVIAAVSPSVFDVGSNRTWDDSPAAGCAPSLMSDHIELMHYETLLLWDVRIACTDQTLNRFAPIADFIISRSEVEGAQRIGTYSNFRLYRIPKKPLSK